MKVSTRGRYGLRAVLQLARAFGGIPVKLGVLAAKEDLSTKYLHALLTSLKAAGLVRSVRGASGGFTLSRPPAEITLREILRALEGPLSLVDCVSDTRTCGKTSACVAHRVWHALSETIEQLLESVTLKDLVVPEGEAIHLSEAFTRRIAENKTPSS